MSGTDQPPSATDSPQRRRVLPRALAALASLMVPVALVASMDVGPLASAATAEPAEPAELARAPREVRTDDAARAILVDLERIAELVAPPPSTPPTTLPSPPAPPAPQASVAVASGSGTGDPGDPASWDRLAACESGGNWAISTGNGYYGGLQFSLSSWQAVGGTGYPHEHSRATQIEMGQRLYHQGGWQHWPGCTRKLGWR